MSLSDLLRASITARRPLLSRLHAEQTNAYRLLQGAVEGAPGISVDRYGSVLLIQTFREPLPEGALKALQQTAEELLEVSLTPVWNHRHNSPTGAAFEGWHPVTLEEPLIALENGMKFLASPRHRGIDPFLFLDLRAGRRLVQERSKDASVLNLFSYTCGVGVAAAMGGAKEVLNVDFASSSLEIGEQNARLNDLPPEQFKNLKENVFPVIRQFSNLPLGLRPRQRRRVHFQKLSPRKFDLVVLDPPRWAKTPFGSVDLIRDYQSLFKPSLLCTREGGAMLVTNNVASIQREDWIDQLTRCAIKAGRPIQKIEIIQPEDDFPSPDGNPPLKMAWLSV